MLKKIAIIVVMGMILGFSQDKSPNKENFDEYFKETTEIVSKAMGDTSLAQYLICRWQFRPFAENLWEYFSDTVKFSGLFSYNDLSKIKKYVITFSFIYYCRGNKQGYESGKEWGHMKGWRDAINGIKAILEDSLSSGVKITWNEDSSKVTASCSPQQNYPPIVIQSPSVIIHEKRRDDFMQDYYQQQMLDEARRFNDLLEREYWRKLIQDWSK